MSYPGQTTCSSSKCGRIVFHCPYCAGEAILKKGDTRVILKSSSKTIKWQNISDLF